MFNRILVASDLTQQSASALRFARTFGQKFGSRLIVTHVVSMPAELMRWRGSDFKDDLKVYDALLARQTAAAEKQLDRQVTTAMLASTRGVQLVVRTGAPAPTLARLVEELDADLVIVARGRGGRLGPVADQLVRLVGRAVLVAPVKGKSTVALDIPSTAPRPPRARRAAV